MFPATPLHFSATAPVALWIRRVYFRLQLSFADAFDFLKLRSVLQVLGASTWCKYL